MRALFAVLVVLVVTATLGCVNEAQPSAVTYADVAPLFARSCVECHDESAQESGRPSLATYESVRDHAEVALLLAESGLMPPSGLDRSGACGELLGPKPLGDDDLALLRAWIDGGKRASPQPLPPESERNDDVTVSATAAVVTSLALSPSDDDEQRCFAVDVGLDGALLTGVRVDGAGPVHHAMVFNVDSSASVDITPGTAWPCPGAPRVDGAQLAFAWVPGRDTSAFPSGYGVPLSRRVVVQLHEHGPTPPGGADHVDVALLVASADDGVRALDVVTLAASGFTLPPARDVVEVERTVALPLGGHVIAAMPHMHALGSALSLAVDADVCLVSAPQWRFSFQELALFAQPLALKAGTRLTLSCAWDTTSRSTSTSWGESSDDEMCTVFLFVARD